jgi:predicted CXXCH cytochrome family protein
MAEASEHRVLGNFARTQFAYAGTTSTFFKRNGGFYVRTDGRDGRLSDFQIKYTFGVYPLQQYLVELPDGRVQALSIAWDARPKPQGGQRWFHLYPGERIAHDDELHWTRAAQNWNFMCADCHSTGLRKNYDRVNDRFQTHWSEINVGCEACHGPGSAHTSWAAHVNTRDQVAVDGDAKGLTARLDERRNVTWNVNVASGNAHRSQPRATDREIEVCAQCHARRGQIADGYEAGKPLLDYYRPALLSDPLYYADGQQRGEVYDWGSFLQSRMYANGVTCSDCHNPHTGKLRAEGNTVCASCHLASKYDNPSHHHHTAGGAGAACVGCHMPTSTYMVIDPRHDHSLRVPRPDLSVKLNTPNACTICHTTRDATWAAMKVNGWYGHQPQGYQQFADALASGTSESPDGQSQLRAVADAATQPPIARATALAGLNASLSQLSLDTVARGLRDPNPLVRLGALQALSSVPPDARLPLAAPLLSDARKVLRVEAVSVLAGVDPEQLSPADRASLARAAGEFVETQRYNADRSEGRVNLGTFFGRFGDTVRAEEEMRVAIRLDPTFVPAYVNLADLYRVRNQNEDSERILREGLKAAPQNASIHYALGLALTRLKRTDDALAELRQALALEPASARFAYVYGVALHSAGQTAAAVATLEKGLATHPYDSEIRTALASFKGPTNAAAPVQR